MYFPVINFTILSSYCTIFTSIQLLNNNNGNNTQILFLKAYYHYSNSTSIPNSSILPY